MCCAVRLAGVVNRLWSHMSDLALCGRPSRVGEKNLGGPRACRCGSIGVSVDGSAIIGPNGIASGNDDPPVAAQLGENASALA